MRPVAFLFLTVCFIACKSSPEDKLVGTWQALTVSNESLETLIREERALLDTLGDKTPPSLYLSTFGFENIDSVRREGRASLDAIEFQRADEVKNTRFVFRPDKVAVIDFGEGPDSAKYFINEEGQLVMDEMALKGVGNSLIMTIEKSTKDSLRLHFSDQGHGSTVAFYKVTKK
jgi:hypothetical protein